MHKSRFVETLVTFIILTVVLTLIEWIGGLLIENLFHETLWNYKHYKYNIGKYIALEMSLLWGIASILIIYYVKPIIDKIVIKIPKIVTLVITTLFIIDLIITTVIKLK